MWCRRASRSHLLLPRDLSASLATRARALGAGCVLFDLLPSKGAYAHLPREGIGGRRCRKYQAVALERKIANLICAGPGLIPRDGGMMDHLVAFDRIGARISRHRAEERLRLGSARNR